MSPNGLSLNLIELGHFAAILAFVLAIVQGLAPIAARVLHRPQLAGLTGNLAVAVFVLTSIGGATIIYSFLTNNFSVLVVASHSNTHMPLFYKMAALWGGHRGSLYLWIWILTLFTMVLAFDGQTRYPERLPVILAVQGWLVAGFFGLSLFLSNPFLRLFPVPTQGADLDPLLQNPGMVMHPPMLYMGYVGFSVPFAFAMAALITKWRSELWIGLIRRWALIAWGFLTLGIVLGAWWSYYVLGWGGYWAWDPVENASFMPWLVGTALIHSITVQERRRMLHTWNIFLVICTFSLSLLGTFLVRSGVLSSVHAFTVDPGQGSYILVFMTVTLAVSFGIFLARGRYQEAEETVTSPMSRESLFVWNNVVFTTAAACVLLGTLYPLAVNALNGSRITVGPPYFNTVMLPIFFIMLLLMAIGPLVPWRKANLSRLRARVVIPVILGLAAGVTMAVLAWPVYWTGPVAVGLVGFVFGTLVVDLARAVQQRRVQHASENVVVATWHTVVGNRRHYGGMIVHLGVLMIAIGIVGTGLFRIEKSVVMAPGDVVKIAGERLRFDGVRTVKGPNYVALQGHLTSLDRGFVLRPERRDYGRQQMPTTNASVNSNLLRDVYVVMGSSVPGKNGVTRYVVQVIINPLVQFLWMGGLTMVFGLGVTLSHRVRRAARAVATEAVSAYVK
ncbi:MAG: heme lyase CcmF/NrfE family subunit [Gammaproteobacteria bacterium]|nr:heme lyase CcmF/NrfE family subunit [Gammaproteobacteria bacterium]